MKKLCLIFCFCLLQFFSTAQSDVLLVNKTQKFQVELDSLSRNSNKAKNKRGLGNAMLTLYQKHISVLISADCLYALSCSRYSREVINKRGLILGILLSADRLSRCAFICSKDIPSYKINDNGFAEDNP